MTAVGYQRIPVTADLQDPSAREESVNSIKSLLQGLLNSITSHFVSNVSLAAAIWMFLDNQTAPRSARYRSEPSLGELGCVRPFSLVKRKANWGGNSWQILSLSLTLMNMISFCST